MKLTIVHDFLNQFGGAERVVGYFLKIFPHTPVYTSIYFPEDTFSTFKNERIETTFMQRIPGIRKRFKRYFFLYPFAFKSIKLKDYEMVLGSSSSYSHFVKKPGNAIHINYCYTPPRFLWETESYLEGEKISRSLSLLMSPVISILRKMDRRQSKNIDHYIAISEYVRKKIKEVYGRDSVIIYPPIEADQHRFNEDKEEFYLVVSRLKGYKRVDIAVKAFNKFGKRLKIVGTGEDEASLREIAGENIEFMGRVSDEELLDLYSKAKALVFTGKEDFGLTPLEAQASGTPVIAFSAGGARETIIDGETGFFFEDQDPESLIKTLVIFEKNPIKPIKCRENALKFDFQNFKKNIFEYVNNIYKNKY